MKAPNAFASPSIGQLVRQLHTPTRRGDNTRRIRVIIDPEWAKEAKESRIAKIESGQNKINVIGESAQEDLLRHRETEPLREEARGKVIEADAQIPHAQLHNP